MLDVARRFLPLLLGPLGALMGSFTGFALHQLATRAIRYFWAPWLGWRWLIGVLAYPALGMLLAIPFVYAFPGGRTAHRSEFGRAQDLHLRTWIAIFAAAYVPVVIGVVYQRWWGAPSLPVPFTDVYLYTGGGGDLLAAMAATALFAPFCAVGVERVLRGVPAVLRLLVGPPVAVLLTMGAVLGAQLIAGACVATWPDPPAYGPLLQPMAAAGWDAGLMLAIDTVVVGAMAGAFAAIIVGMGALSGVVDVRLPGSALRWGLGLASTAVTGALAIIALAQGFGLDSLRGFDQDVWPGQRGVEGTLVAPGDQDVLSLHTDTSGLHLLEFPDPAHHGRHWASTSGYALPSVRPGVLRFLLDVPAGMGEQELMVQPTWPLKTGVAAYRGGVRWEYIPVRGTGEEQGAAPVAIDVAAGELVAWDVDLRAGPRELVLDADVPVELTMLGPRTTGIGDWAWAPGWSVALVSVSAGGHELASTVLGDEGYTLEGVTLSVGDASAGEAPDVRVRLEPAARDGEVMRIPVVARGLDPGEPLLFSPRGPTVLTATDDDVMRLVPEPGGSFGSIVFQPLDRAGGLTLERRRDDGGWEEAAGELLLLGEAAMRVRGGRPGDRAAVAVVSTAGSSTSYGAAGWTLPAP